MEGWVKQVFCDVSVDMQYTDYKADALTKVLCYELLDTKYNIFLNIICNNLCASYEDYWDSIKTTASYEWLQ